MLETECAAIAVARAFFARRRCLRNPCDKASASQDTFFVLPLCFQWRRRCTNEGVVIDDKMEMSCIPAGSFRRYSFVQSFKENVKRKYALAL